MRASPKRPGIAAGAHGSATMSRSDLTIDDLRHQLRRLATEPRFAQACIPGRSRIGLPRPGGDGEPVASLSTEYRRMGSLKAIRRQGAETLRDVTEGDIDRDELVQAFARQAVAALNSQAVGTSPGAVRERLTMVAAVATATYSFWTPTIQASGCAGWSHLEVKKRLGSTSWASWWAVREYAPVIIGKTGGPRSVRTPLHQFLIHMRLRSLYPLQGDSHWQRIRSLGSDVNWNDLVDDRVVSRRQGERWLCGAIAIPDGFLSDAKLNPHHLDTPGPDDLQTFATVRSIQLLWGLCAKERRKDRLARVFSGLMDIPYAGRLIP